MKKSNILLGIVGWGFVLNGAAKILFANWFQNTVHYPIDGDDSLFSLLEAASGVVILLRWRLSKIVGSFSRIAGLLYAGFSLSVAILLPFLGKEFQYLSVKVLNLIYFCFYLFCLSILSNRSIKALFPSVEVEERIFPGASQVSYEQALDEKMIHRISFWVKLIAVILILDSISLSFLSFLWFKTVSWYERVSSMLLELSAGFSLFGRSPGNRKWASVSCLLLSIGGLIFSPIFYFFLLPGMEGENPELAYQFTSRPYLLPVYLIYGVLFFSIFLFLNRSSTKQYFEMPEEKEIS